MSRVFFLKPASGLVEGFASRRGYMSAITFPVLSLIAVFLLPTAHAHHSFTAEFTAEKTAKLTGVVEQVWFRNPHVRYVFTVTNDEGEEERWDARGSPVVWLARKGWTRDTIAVGDTVTFYGFLGRDERRMLSIMSVTLEDGTEYIDRVPE